MRCRLCGSSNLNDYLVDGLYKCFDCTFVQRSGVYNPIQTSIDQESFRVTSTVDMEKNSEYDLPDLIKSQYHVYLEDFNRINIFLTEFSNRNFIKNDIVNFIDVGSGIGFMSFKLKESLSFLNMHLLEINKQKIDIGVDAFKPDLNNFTFHNEYLNSDFSERYNCYFDITFSFHVLEHVENVIEFVKSMYEITKRGGHIIIEVPNQDDDLIGISPEYSKIINFPAHVSNFTKKTLSFLIEKTGIDVSDVEYIPIQRYGFFNYIDWIRFDSKEHVLSDDYTPRDKISWIERMWIEHKKENFTTDSIMVIIKK